MREAAAGFSSFGKAFLVASFGIACFATMQVLMKQISIELGTYNALLWRSLFLVAIAASAFVIARNRVPGLPVLRLHLMRGMIVSGVAVLFFWGLVRVPVAQAVALSFVAPLFALYLASAILKEKIAPLAIVGSLIGFAGVVIVLSGQFGSASQPGVLLGSIAVLASAGIHGWNLVVTRQQAIAARPVEIAFFTSLVMSMCFLFAAPFLAEIPPSSSLVLIAAAAMFTFLSLLLLAWAYARSEAQRLAPVEYTTFIWAALLAFVFFSEPLTLATFVGAVLIAGGCLIANYQRSIPCAARLPDGHPPASMRS